MICCRCLKPLQPGPLGSYLRCCDGIGYFSPLKPDARDMWALWAMRRVDGVLMWLYRGPTRSCSK